MFTDELDELDAQMPYNCEHVVPQSSFAKKEPMRGDLHHLFTCESRCNSFRSNTPYFDFDDDRAVMQDCGRSEQDKFEPRASKGAVARATMYFLLRYPGMIGDESRELQAERLPILLAWHEAEPVVEWERHRNAAIFELRKPKPARSTIRSGQAESRFNGVRQTRRITASVLQQVAHHDSRIAQPSQFFQIFCAGDDFGIAPVRTEFKDRTLCRAVPATASGRESPPPAGVSTSRRGH